MAVLSSSDLPDLRNLQPTFCAYGADHTSSDLHSLSPRNQPMIQPAKYRCIHLFSCLHDGGRQSSRSAAGRPRPVRNREICKRSLGRRHQILKPLGRMNRNRNRNAKPCHQSHHKPVHEVPRLCLNTLSIFLSGIINPKFISVPRPFFHS